MNMKVVSVHAALVFALLSAPGLSRAENWPDWRGPDYTSIYESQELAQEWSAEKNVKWSVETDAWGYSSPIIWEDKIILTSQQGQVQGARRSRGGARAAAAAPSAQEAQAAGAAPESRGARAAQSAEGATTPRVANRGARATVATVADPDAAQESNISRSRYNAAEDTRPLTLFVECRAREGGALLWRTPIPHSVAVSSYSDTNMASSSPTTDGEHIYATFASGDLACLDMNGEIIWSRPLATEYGSFNLMHGHATSPVLFEDLLIMHFGHANTAGGQGGRGAGGAAPTTGAEAAATPAPTPEPDPHPSVWRVMGFDKLTGETRYDTVRPLVEGSAASRATGNTFATPLIYKLEDGQERMAIPDHGRATIYNPRDGKPIWEVAGLIWGQLAPSPRYGDGLLFVPSSGEYGTLALYAAGQGEIMRGPLLWAEQRDYTGGVVSSPIYYQGLFYQISQRGILKCFDARTGEILYVENLPGQHYATPLVNRGRIFYQTTDGFGYVVKAGREFQLLQKNEIDERCLGSCAAADGQIYLRTDKHLYCIARQE